MWPRWLHSEAYGEAVSLGVPMITTPLRRITPHRFSHRAAQVLHEPVLTLALDVLDDVQRVGTIKRARRPVHGEVDDFVGRVEALAVRLLARPVHEDRIEVDPVDGGDLLEHDVGAEAIAAA